LIINRVPSDNHPVSAIFRLARRCQISLEKLWPGFSISRLMRIGASQVTSSAAEINDRFSHFTEHLPFSTIDFHAVIPPRYKDKLTHLAEELLQHRFNLLGSGPLDLDRTLPWHQDFVTGYQWDRSLLYSMVRETTPKGSDIKRPWELSRCQHFIPLGLAWKVSLKEEYLSEYVTQIEDWVNQNRVGYGVNWVCPMDIAIRAVNWLVGYALFCPGIARPEFDEFRGRLTVSLWEHARFLRSHLEWNGPFSERRANHFLANLTGLFTLGIFFSDTARGNRWLRFSKKWFESETNRQFLDDGVHFECSTSYHRLCLEMVLWVHSLAKHRGFNLSRSVEERLAKMCAFTSAYTRPDGLAPLIGDNDDGRLMSTGLGDINDHSYLYSDSYNSVSKTNLLLISGGELPDFASPTDFLACEKSGLFICWRSTYHLIVRAGRLAHLGAHAHCDQLSFELSIHGTPVFVDRGSYVYTSDPYNRNRYRGTHAHNVLAVNEAEQNRMIGMLFGYVDDTQTQVLKATNQEIIAQHTGFKSLDRPTLAHKRLFRIKNGGTSIDIVDHIINVEKDDSIHWFFHLNSGLTPDISDHQVLISKNGDYICSLVFPEHISIESERFHHSPSYGCLEIAESLRLRVKVDEPSECYEAIFSIEWKAS
jgi:hypothetical protein